MLKRSLILLVFLCFSFLTSVGQDTLVEIRGKIIKDSRDTNIVTFFADSIEVYTMVVFSDTNYSFQMFKRYLKKPFRTEYIDPQKFRFLDSTACLDALPEFWSHGIYDRFDTIDDREVYVKDFGIRWRWPVYSNEWYYATNSMELAFGDYEDLACRIRTAISRSKPHIFITLLAFSGHSEKLEKELPIKRAEIMREIMISNGYPAELIRIKYMGKSEHSALEYGQGRGYIRLSLIEK